MFSQPISRVLFGRLLDSDNHLSKRQDSDIEHGSLSFRLSANLTRLPVRFTHRRYHKPTCLAPNRVYLPDMSPYQAVSSCLTLFTLTPRGGICFCGTFPNLRTHPQSHVELKIHNFVRKARKQMIDIYYI